MGNEIPGHIVYQDELVTAFLDIQPLNDGHVLIIPNTHFKLISDVDICSDGPPGYDSITRQIELMESHIYYKIISNNILIGGFFTKGIPKLERWNK